MGVPLAWFGGPDLIGAPFTWCKRLWHGGSAFGTVDMPLGGWLVGLHLVWCTSALRLPPAYYGALGLMGVPLAGCSTYGLVWFIWPGPHRGTSTLNYIGAPLAWTK